MLKITTSPTKSMNIPSAGKISSSGNPKIEFGKSKQMFLNLESKTENVNYSNENPNDPIRWNINVFFVFLNIFNNLVL